MEDIYSATSFPPISTFSKKGDENFLDQFESELRNAMVKSVSSEEGCFKSSLEYFGIPTTDFSETELSDNSVPVGKLKLLQKYIKINPEV